LTGSASGSRAWLGGSPSQFSSASRRRTTPETGVLPETQSAKFHSPEFRSARDRNGNEIENFGGIDNLMLTQSVIAIYATFEEAVASLRRFLAQ
jgi:hypothetical protein